jgi:hypothetical protein
MKGQVRFFRTWPFVTASQSAEAKLRRPILRQAYSAELEELPELREVAAELGQEITQLG